ncbi:carboxypeptidase-like regulatory domain-containing protein [Cystobacter ferrugineus]|uniref:Carboxypeptidase regulatory-like domain-containing protein n=1 Tax=Cystobacter ferrugineus TaxID=83449 RepID=A0A1L9AVF4_9BACT|nr:carboxypeptidase-like regulatory domain-containing protein [Cystobacter ferrugineus]OJH33989.1 hypothetical protein BON30_45895 [Cystobacter ferrugineus]
MLQVIDDSGHPVSGAAVSSREALFPVDSTGHLLLENLPSGRFLARVDALGFTSATAVMELQKGTHVGAQVKLLRLPDPLPFQAEAGGILETPQVRVTLPASAVVDALGQPVTGTVNVTIAPLDPTRQLGSMPGPLEGTSAVDGQPVQLESFFMAEVGLWSNGAPVQLAPGKSATLEFLLPEALASQFHEGDTVPAWWFDLDAGQWREEGQGTVQPSSTQPGRLAWVAQVKHFTWWNCDMPWTDKSCVNVLFVDGAGAPVAGAAVRAEGLSYSGDSGISYTGADGRVCVEIKRGNTARIVALQGTLSSDGVAVTGSSTAAVCGGSGPCTDVRLVVRGPVCAPGAYQACPYTGPAGTEGQGSCRAARQRCNVSGAEWSACAGQVLPTAESCRTPFDDDCDGTVNEGCSCSDLMGLPCYGGSSGTQGVGACHAGTVRCDSFGNVVCLGQQLPRPENCSTLEDEDCNGRSEGCEPVSPWFWQLDTTCSSTSKPLGVAVDRQGNTLTLNSLSGTVTLGGTAFTGDEGDMLLVKVDGKGHPTWAQLIDIYARSAYLATKEGLAVDAAGNVVVSGSFSGDLKVGGISLANYAPPKTFVVKFAPDGSPLWAQTFGGELGSAAVATDAAGNIALLAIPSGSGFYVAKLDGNTGATLWSRFFVGPVAFATAIDMDEEGNVLLAADMFAEIDLDGIVLRPPAAATFAFVTKFDGATGKARWGRVVARVSGEGGVPLYLKAARAGKIWVLTPQSGGTRLVALSSEGEELWARGTSAYLDSLHLGTDASGNARVSGAFSGSVDLGGGSRASSNPAAFVAWYDPAGNYLKDRVYPTAEGGGGHSGGVGTGVDLEGSVLLGGWFTGAANFGLGPVNACSDTTFVLKMEPSSTP